MSDLDHLVKSFHAGAMFQIGQIKHGAAEAFSSNFCREYARVIHGCRFSNTRSPVILREMVRRHPELRDWVELGRRWT